MDEDNVIVLVVDEDTGVLKVQDESQDLENNYLKQLLQLLDTNSIKDEVIDIKEDQTEYLEDFYFQTIPKDVEEEFTKDLNIEPEPTTNLIEFQKQHGLEDTSNKIVTKGKNKNSNVDKSFIAQLWKDNPELREDHDAVVKALMTMMKAETKPYVGDDYYVMLGKKQYQCLTCKSVNSTKGDCERHYIMHHGPRYLVCYACGMDFRSKPNLYKHEKRCVSPGTELVLRARLIIAADKARSRGIEKKYECELCPAVYLMKSSLISHERLHRGERPFQCKLCPNSYTCKSVLTKHMYTHGDEKFVCDYCGRTFKHKSLLSSHIAIHGEPKLLCPECPRRFTYRTALNLHVRSRHRNLPPPCACQMCPKRFGRMWALKDHMKKMHGMVLMTRTMFFKKVPSMTESEISEAMIVLRDKTPVTYAYNKTEARKKRRAIDEQSGLLNPTTGLLLDHSMQYIKLE